MANPEHRSSLLGETYQNTEEYDAGFAARLQRDALSVSATPSWQAGWTDADREIGEPAVTATISQALLPFFGTGSQARREGLPFDISCSEEWKRGWIETDIDLGVQDMGRFVVLK